MGLSPDLDTCVLKQGTCFSFDLGCKAVGPVCSEMYFKEPSALASFPKHTCHKNDHFEMSVIKCYIKNLYYYKLSTF